MPKLSAHGGQMMDFNISEDILYLCQLISKSGYSVRLVGGSVRDYLLGVNPKDIDLATSALPDQIIELAKNNSITCIATGLQHGTLTLVINGQPIEITTLRIDTNADGRHAEVEFTTDWHLDALRRDFTINAMSYDPLSKTLYDYFDGKSDLESRKIVFVGNPVDRIQEDYLRVFRYFRFVGRLKSSISPEYIDLFKQKWIKEGIQTLSVERVWMEMRRILSQDEKSIYDILNTGILSVYGIRPPANDFYLTGTTVSLLRLSYMTDHDISRIWKFSSIDSSEFNYYVERNWFDTPLDVMEIRRRLVDGDNREYILNILAHIGDQELMDYVNTWSVPVFPVRGQDLIDSGMVSGPELGKRLARMRRLWIESEYSLNREELLKLE